MNYNFGNRGLHPTHMRSPFAYNRHIPPPMTRGVPYVVRPGFRFEGPPLRGSPFKMHPYEIFRPFGNELQTYKYEGKNNNKTPFNIMDLTKPWVNEDINSEFVKKDELLNKAKSTSQQEDWALYREQKNKCSKIYNNAELEFQRQENSKEMISYDGHNEFNEKEEDKEESSIACDACDIVFAHKAAFNEHLAEHKVCCLDGCTFSADEKNIEEHKQNQHSNESSEKIKLEVAKWQEERRLRHTLNKANKERTQNNQEELQRKGIRIGERNNKFGKDKKRFEHKDPQVMQKVREKLYKKKKLRRNKNIQKLQPKLVFEEKLDYNNGLPPFKGIQVPFEVEHKETFNISDDEEDFNKKPTKIDDLVQVNSSLGALMAYGSDFSEDDEEIPKNIEKETCIMKPLENISGMQENSNEIKSEEEGPLEVKIERTGIVYENEKEENSSVIPNRRRTNIKNKSKMITKNDSHKFPYELKSRKISLLEKLLDGDIRRERNMVLQFVRYTVENNFFLKAPFNNDQASSETAQGTS